MNLEDLLNKRLKSLFLEYDKDLEILNSNKSRLQKNNSDLEIVNSFLSNLNNSEDIRNIDTSYINSLLLERHIIDENNIKELDTIKILLKGIYDNKLMISLYENQTNLLNEYIDSINRLKSELENNKLLLEEEYVPLKEEFNYIENMILELQETLEKVSDLDNNDVLNLNDYKVIKDIVDDSSVDINTKKNILVCFVNYNLDRKNNVKKIKEIDIDEVIELFKKYGRDIRNKIYTYKNDVITSGNINNIKEILDFLTKKQIINNFDDTDLLYICVYATLDSVKSTFDLIAKYPDRFYYFLTVEAWENSVDSKPVKRRKYSKKDEKHKVVKSLKEHGNKISKYGITDNVEYLKSKGFSIKQDDLALKKVIETPHYKIKEAVESLFDYGIVNKNNASSFNRIWLLAEPLLLNKIDRFVELGLLHGISSYNEFNNYAIKYLSKLHNMEYPDYLQLYRAKQDSTETAYYEAIASVKKGQITRDINSRFNDTLDSGDKIDEFIQNNFVDYNKVIPNYSKYENDIDYEYNVQIDNNIFKLPEIIDLENNYRVQGNNYVYNFNGVIISRLKVLRNYSVVHDGTQESLLSSIVYGSYLTPESLKNIADCIGYILGGDYGLSSKYNLSDKDINEIIDCISEKDLVEYQIRKDDIVKILDYFINRKVNNIKELLKYKSYIFYNNYELVKNKLDTINDEDFIKINDDVDIIDELI